MIHRCVVVNIFSSTACRTAVFHYVYACAVLQARTLRSEASTSEPTSSRDPFSDIPPIYAEEEFASPEKANRVLNDGRVRRC